MKVQTKAGARLGAVAATVLAALTVSLIAEHALAIDLWSPRMGTRPSADINVFHVLGASAVASLVGWAFLAALERVTAVARQVWTVLAIVAGLASFGGPFSGTGITTANRVVLVVLHIAVAAVLVTMMYRTSPTSGPQRTARMLSTVRH